MQNTKALGIASLVCGIVGIVLSFFGVTALISLALGIVALILGVKARKDEATKGMGTAGLVLGIITVVFGGIGTICWICATCIYNSTMGAANELLSGIEELEGLY